MDNRKSSTIRAYVVTRLDLTPIVVLASDTHAGTVSAFSYVAHLLTTLDDHGGASVHTHEIDTTNADTMVPAIRGIWRHVVSLYPAHALDSLAMTWPAETGLTARNEMARTAIFKQVHEMFSDLV